MANGFWVRQEGSDSHGSVETAVETQVLVNSGSSIQENRRITCLGYYLTMFSPTSNLYVVRMIGPHAELIGAADFTSVTPEDDDSLIWAKHYAHAGVPAYFQIKSKRTFGPDDKLHLQTFCVNTADTIHWSWQSYVVAS